MYRFPFALALTLLATVTVHDPSVCANGFACVCFLRASDFSCVGVGHATRLTDGKSPLSPRLTKKKVFLPR